MKHSNSVPNYPGDIEQLAEQLGDLFYDTLADFLHLMSEKMLRDANADMRRNRPKLSGHLMACSKQLEHASYEIQKAWDICRHYIDEKENNNKEITMNKNSRSNRSAIATDTLKTLEQGYYTTSRGETNTLTHQINTCVSQTKLYTPEALAALPTCIPMYKSNTLEVVNETTLAGAKRLADSGRYARIGVLNFASAKNPGGGFLGGSQAQEETLARSSALYPSLQQCQEYYDYHKRLHKSLLYSDHMIVSPQCPVFKQDDGAYLDKTYCVDIITSPAPNRGAIARNEPESLDKIESLFAQRIRYVLQLAIHQQCDALVLGAWGCGVFGNLPDQVAALFAQHLIGKGEYSQAFHHVSFSIPENPKAMANTEAFQRALGV